MSSPIIATDSHPNQGFDNIAQLGLKAWNLAVLHQSVIEPRLPTGTINGLAGDLDTLGVIVPGAMQVRQESQTATAEQRAALKRGYTWIQTVRTAVRKAGASKEVQKAYTVGLSLSPVMTRDVKAALKQILDRASPNPAEATALGIVKKDLDAMSATYQLIADVDKDQNQKRASASLSTKARNRTANRVLKAVARIAAAGMLEFVDAPEHREGFEALKPPSKSRSRSTNTSAAAN